MIFRTQPPPPASKSSILSFLNRGKKPPPPVKQTDKWSSIQKATAALSTLSFISFSAKCIELYLTPAQNTSDGLSGFAKVALAATPVVAVAAYYKFGKPTINIQNPASSQTTQNSKNQSSNKTVTNPPKTTSTTSKPLAQDGRTSYNSLGFTPTHSSSSSNLVKPNRPPPSPHSKTNQINEITQHQTNNGIANNSGSANQSPQKNYENFTVPTVSLKATPHILTPEEKLKQENEELEKKKKKLEQLPIEERRKHPEALKLLDAQDTLGALNDNPEYKKIEWLNEFGQNKIINESKAAELRKLLLQKIDTRGFAEEKTEAINKDFKLYAKIELFWVAITNDKLRQAAVNALSPVQVEILVSEVMSGFPYARMPQLNAILLALTSCKNNDLKKDKLIEIAKCGHPDLNVAKLEAAAKTLKINNEVMQIRNNAKDEFLKKLKKENEAAEKEKNQMASTQQQPVENPGQKLLGSPSK